MKADSRFANKPQGFWGIVKLISQNLGYTTNGQIHTFSVEEIESFLTDENLKLPDTVRIEDIVSYLSYRADLLNNLVQKNLMDVKAASKLFRSLKRENKPTCPIPLNKQKGEKKPKHFLRVQ